MAMVTKRMTKMTMMMMRHKTALLTTARNMTFQSKKTRETCKQGFNAQCC